VVQDQEDWLDLSGFGEIACWIDVMEVTPPGNTSTTSVQLVIESSPTVDEANFIQTTPTVNIGSALPFYTASTTPFVVRSMSNLGYPLARYLRWRLLPSTTGLWDITFRIRVVASRSVMTFRPTQISGALLWLRGDLGITLNGANVSSWADQSGSGNTATQGTAADQPAYAPIGINGVPAILGNGTSTYLKTPSMSVPTTTTIFTVVQPLGTGNTLRILDMDNVTAYYLGTDATPGAHYKLIVANNTSPYGTAVAGSTVNAPSIVSATYDGTNGTVYYNVTTSSSCPFPNPSGSLPMYIMTGYFIGDYWNGYVAEILMYSSLLSMASQRQIYRYLGARYGIPVP